jgi:hypothetical protein
MEKMGIEIASTYKYLYSFNYEKGPCTRMIKDLVVKLVQILRKHNMMDVVVANVPSTYGMLSSHC